MHALAPTWAALLSAAEVGAGWKPSLTFDDEALEADEVVTVLQAAILT